MRFALLLLLLCGCSRESPTTVGGRTMGTTWSLRVHPGTPLPPVQDLQQKLDSWESILSHWQPDSALSRFNTSSSTEWMPVPSELIEVVELAQRVGTETDHALDITLAPLIELWGFGSTGRRSTPPSSEEIAAARAVCGWQHLHTRHDPPALRKDIPALRINVSAVAEGWALDHLAQHLESTGLKSFLLEIGGEVLACGEWRVGVQTPAAPPGETAHTLRLKNQSIATSGVYRQHFMADGKKYAHILDPRTGSPIAHSLASVSVIHASAALADGYATALLVLGPSEGRTLAEKLGLQAIWFERKKLLPRSKARCPEPGALCYHTPCMFHVAEDHEEGMTGRISRPPLAPRMHHAFSTEGRMAASPQFEYRPQQQRMAELVGAALDGNHAFVCEAATGVGKSLAYLVPAVTFALEQKRKAIICTHTINLQEQLISKDIPIVRQLVGNFHAEILKGRGNYICPTRLKRALNESADLFSTSEAGELKMLLDWVATTEDGTLSDLDFTPSARVWSLVCSEPHACTPRRCPPGSRCWYQDVRRRMEQADVVVLNHTLFFTLLASADETTAEDCNFLFPRDFVILDEAHTIENVAARAFGLHISESNIKFELGRLHNPKTRKGFFQLLGDKDGIREVLQTLDNVDTFFREAEAACKFNALGREFRVREAGLIEDTLSLPLQRLSLRAQKAGDAVDREGTKLELLDLSKRLTSIRVGIKAFLDQENEDHVHWVERTSHENRIVSFHTAPVDVAPRLKQIFFSSHKACVFTSATLGIGDDSELNYFRNRVGAEDARAACIESPFNFKKQMKLYLLKKMPQPSDPGYLEKLEHWITHFVDLSSGRAFILFTSYSQMTSLADNLEAHCEKRGWRLLVQGRGMPRHQMLAEFKNDTHSVLCGTDSFWTGVDVPGEALSNVIITRLPFAVPDHPLTASRIEHLEAQGLNPFTEYSVPEAILKLRQGVGRLIRTATDKGICAILDNRILTKPYGRAFLASLPECPTEIMQ